MNPSLGHFSYKQRLFADYLLIKIGVRNTQLRSLYLEYLEKMYAVWDGEYWTVSSAIDALLDETTLKKELEKIDQKTLFESIAATDLSHFTYCPASYAISRSFEITKVNALENTQHGINFHEQLNLLKYTRRETDSEINIFREQEALYNRPNYISGIPEEIAKSTIIYCGHEAEKRYFSNGKLVGAPDYIFQNEKGQYFVVEEKFHRKRDPFRMSYREASYDEIDPETEKARRQWENHQGFFFDNHLVQIVSYIKNIKEYTISYGYLLYWYYDMDYDRNVPYIHRTISTRVELNKKYEGMYATALKGISSLQEEKKQSFDANAIKVEKCTSCVVGKYCGHKTGRYSELTFPYKKEYLKLFFAKFPDELRKEREDNRPSVITQPFKTQHSLNIDGIKELLGIPVLNMIRQLKKDGSKTPWVSHWEPEKRIRVTMHETVMKTIQSNKLTPLVYDKQEVPSATERDGYVRYILHLRQGPTQ